VPLQYLNPPGVRLVQGEILGPVWEYVPRQPPIEVPAEQAEVPVRGIRHERMVVLSQDCDLLQDFNLRFPGGDLTSEPVDLEADPRAIPSVFLCEAFEDLRSRVAGGDIFRRAQRNQDERYHALPEAPVGDTGTDLPGLFLDFRKVIALPTPFVYEGLRSHGVSRIAIVPPFYIHDLVQRCWSYHARVAIEE
jgi:hypothetical protein